MPSTVSEMELDGTTREFPCNANDVFTSSFVAIIPPAPVTNCVNGRWEKLVTIVEDDPEIMLLQ